LWNDGVEDRDQPLCGRQVLARQLPQDGQRRVRRETAQVRLHEGVLGREVLVEGARRDVRGAREGGDPGRVDAVLVEQPAGRRQDALARAAAPHSFHPKSIAIVLLLRTTVLWSSK
jgi:hypothetical protein